MKLLVATFALLLAIGAHVPIDVVTSEIAAPQYIRSQRQQQHHNEQQQNNENDDFERTNMVPMSASGNAGPIYHIEMPEIINEDSNKKSAINDKPESDKKQQRQSWDEMSLAEASEAWNKRTKDDDVQQSQSSSSSSNSDQTAERPASSDADSSSFSMSSSSSSGNSDDSNDEPTGTFHVRRIIIAPSMGGPSSWFNNPFAMMSPSIHAFPASTDRVRAPSSIFGNGGPSLWSLLGGSVMDDESVSSSSSSSSDNGESPLESADSSFVGPLSSSFAEHEREQPTAGASGADQDNQREASETKPAQAELSEASRPIWGPYMMSDRRNQLMNMLQQVFQSHLGVFPELQRHLGDMLPSASDIANGGANNNNSSNTNSNTDSENTNNNGTSNGSSFKPGNTHNEIKEDIVEYDGVKYLRKTIITKNIGPSHMFFTKRYIMTPLNETTPTNTTTMAPKAASETNATTTTINTNTNNTIANVTPVPISTSVKADKTEYVLSPASSSPRAMSPQASNTNSSVSSEPAIVDEATKVSVEATTTSTPAPSNPSVSGAKDREQLEKDESVTVPQASSSQANKKDGNSTSVEASASANWDAAVASAAAEDSTKERLSRQRFAWR